MVTLRTKHALLSLLAAGAVISVTSISQATEIGDLEKRMAALEIQLERLSTTTGRQTNLRGDRRLVFASGASWPFCEPRNISSPLKGGSDDTFFRSYWRERARSGH